MNSDSVRTRFSFIPGFKQQRLKAACLIDGTVMRYLEVDHADFGKNKCISRSFVVDLSMKKDAEYLTTELGALYRAAFDALEEKNAAKNIPIHFVLPPRRCAFRTIETNGLQLEEARLALRYDFERYFSFAEAEAAYDIVETCVPNKDGACKQAFLLAASRRSLVEPLMQVSTERAFNLCSVEPAHISVERLLRMCVQEEDPALFLFIGNGVAFLFLSVGGRTFFYHAFEHSLSGDKNTIVKSALSEALRQSLDFALAQYPDFIARRVHLFCSVEAEADVVRSYGRDFFACGDVRVHTLEQFYENFANDKEVFADWVIPFGAALRGI